MLIRKVPGPVGVRPARVLTRASSQHLSAGHLTALDGAQKVAIAFWINPNAQTFNFDTILAQLGLEGTGVGETSGVALLWNTTGTPGVLAAFRNNNAAEYNTYNAFLTVGLWQHVVMQFDGSIATTTARVSLYRNGQLITPTTARAAPATLGTTNQPFVIGSEGTRRYSGAAVAGMGVWVGRTLGAGEITQLAAGAHPSTLGASQLLECWDLDRVGPIVGLVRGTVLAPVNGGSLTAGPNIQGPPRLRRSFAATAGAPTNYTLTAETESVAATGQTATLKRSRLVTATTAAVQATTTSVSVRYARALAAITTAAALTGQNASAFYARLVAGLTVVVDLSGQTATLTKTAIDKTIEAVGGTITATGQNASLLVSRVLNGTSSAVATTTTGISTLYGRIVKGQTQTVEAQAPSATLTYSAESGPSAAEKAKDLMMKGIVASWIVVIGF